jgi:hypothetical protein
MKQLIALFIAISFALGCGVFYAICVVPKLAQPLNPHLNTHEVFQKESEKFFTDSIKFQSDCNRVTVEQWDALDCTNRKVELHERDLKLEGMYAEIQQEWR